MEKDFIVKYGNLVAAVSLRGEPEHLESDANGNLVIQTRDTFKVTCQILDRREVK